MTISPFVVWEILTRTLDAHKVESIETMPGEQMFTVGAAMRAALKDGGATDDDLAAILGNVITRIDAAASLSDEQRDASIRGLCRSFGFDVERIPTGPNRATYALKLQGAKPTIRALRFADLATGARYISTAQGAGASDEHFADYEAIREGAAVIILPDGTTWAMCCGSARRAWAPSGWPSADHIEDLAAEHAISECASGERMHEVYIDTALPDGTRCFCSECGPISLVPAPDGSARVH